MLRAAAALTLVATLVAGCGSGAADVVRDDRGRPTEDGPVRVDRIRVGDCFDDQDDRSPGMLPVRPCDEPHDNEVFALVDVPGDDYPGQDALTDIAIARCTGRAFTDYVGVGYDDQTELDVFEIIPSPDTWVHDGDHTVVCALFARDRSPLARSMGGDRA